MHRQLVSIEDHHVAVVDIRDPCQKVLGRSRSCQITLSSSVHALVVDWTLGIPLSWMTSEGIIADTLKTQDHYLCTPRDIRASTIWSRGLARAVDNAGTSSDCGYPSALRCPERNPFLELPSELLRSPCQLATSERPSCKVDSCREDAATSISLWWRDE